MEIFYNILLDRVMLKIFQKGTITIDRLLDFLKQNSWYGIELYKTTASGDKIPYTWLEMITPALKSYFKESTLYVNEDPAASFILPIDSLALKIEGIIRDMHRFSDIPTSYPKRVGRNQIIQEKDLNKLFAENKIPYFTENEMMYF